MQGETIVKKSILLVDDNKLLIEIQKDFLQNNNVDIITANNGKEVLDILQSRQPDLIFMDFEMPAMDGIECCKTIKSDPDLSCIPVVMVTAGKNEEIKISCLSAGCDHFLTKPLNRNTFLGIAKKFIPGIERREKRKKVNFDAIFSSNGLPVDCTLYDLSSGGAFISTDQLPPLNSVIQISFTLPNGTSIQCSSRIIWVNETLSQRPRGIGIRFALLSKEAMEALENFLD